MTAVAPLGRNGIAFGGPVLQIRFTRSITHGKKGRRGRGSLAGSVVTAEVGSRVSMKGFQAGYEVFMAMPGFQNEDQRKDAWKPF